MQLKQFYDVATKVSIIAQVYRLSAVHCQVTRYSQRVPGYLIRYSQSQPMKSLWTKNSQSDCVFQLLLGLEELSTWWFQQAFLKA